MSINPAEILERKLQDFIRRAPKIAGVYAVEQFRLNIRKRGGVFVNGNLDEFTPRGYETARTRGKKLLLGTGNMVDSIQLISLMQNQVIFGISQRDIAKYAKMHLMGGTVTVTPKMKSFFWAMYFQAQGNIKTTKRGKQSKVKSSSQAAGDAGFWKAMALKKVGSKINIPKREFMRLTPDLEKGIYQEFEYEINKIKKPTS